MGPTERTDDKLSDLEEVSLEEEAKYIRKTSTWDVDKDHILSMTTEYFLEAPPPEQQRPEWDEPWVHRYPLALVFIVIAIAWMVVATADCVSNGC